LDILIALWTQCPTGNLAIYIGQWQINIHLKGAALGTLCKFLPTFCGHTCSGYTGGHSGAGLLVTSTGSMTCQQHSQVSPVVCIPLPCCASIALAPQNHTPVSIPAKTTASVPYGTNTSCLPVPAWVQTPGAMTMLSSDVAGPSTASTPHTATTAHLQQQAVAGPMSHTMQLAPLCLVTDPCFEHICNPDGYTMLANACCTAIPAWPRIPFPVSLSHSSALTSPYLTMYRAGACSCCRMS
jgi:hypothetical protein